MDALTISAALSGVISLIVAITRLLYYAFAYTVRRPLDLFDLYGVSGIFLYLFGSRTTWRTEAHVLGTVSDDDALNFKKAVQDECTMISVAAAIIAQIAITALSLDNISRTHWIVKASFSFSIISSLIAVYYASTQQRVIGRLLQAKQVRNWIRYRIPTQRNDSPTQRNDSPTQRNDSFWEFQRPHISRGDPLEHVTSALSGPQDLSSEEIMKQYFTPSVASVITMSAPQILLSASLLSLLIGLGMYFGFIWTQQLDVDAEGNSSRNILIFYLFTLILCFAVYSISRLIQDDETRTERQILLKYTEDFIEKYVDITRHSKANAIVPEAGSIGAPVEAPTKRLP